MQKKQLFISRSLGADSPFREALEGQPITIVDQSLVAFESVAFVAIPKVDWLFFYSKNGVKYCLEQLTEQQRQQLPLLATIGVGTAQFLEEEYGLRADFVGNGKPPAVAAAFLAVAQSKNVCFVEARQSRRSVELLLEGQIKGTNLVVYNNLPKTGFELTAMDILVFTSPLNAQAYFHKYPYEQHQQVVCIGNTTAQAVTQYGVQEYKIAASPNEQSLAAACLNK